MASGIESIQNTKAVPQPNEIRAVNPTTINPSETRLRSGKDRRQQKTALEKSAFLTALEAVTAAGNPFSPQAALQARRASRAAAIAEGQGTEKVPLAAPTEIGADESERLFLEKNAVPTRDAKAVAEPAPPQMIPSSPEFFAAASQYAERFFSVKGAFAKPGESLEIKA